MKFLWLVLDAYRLLIQHELYLRHHSFEDVCLRLQRTGVTYPPLKDEDIPSICDAVDTSVALYFKPVFCLQKSVVLCHLLRRRGVAARFVIGVQQAPFQAHAWVEVKGAIIRDALAEQENFQVLEVYG